MFLGSTNKSSYVINALCGESVHIEWFFEMQLNYLFAGHSKTIADRVFANIATALSKCDYYNH